VLRSRRRAVAALATGVVTAGVFFGVLPHVADLGDVWRLIRTLPAAEIAALLALTVLNLAPYAWLSQASLPGLRFGPALVVTQTSTAVANTVPAGGGVGVGVTYAMYAHYDFDPTAIALSITTTGVANLFVKFAMPAVAAVLLAVAGDAPSWTWHAARIGVALTLVTVLFVWAVLAERPSARAVVRSGARLVARARGRDRDAAAHAAEERLALVDHDAAALFRPRGLLILLLAVVSHLALYVLFAACLAAVSVDLPVSVSFAVFAVVRLGLAVPVTPGSVGVAEAGYAAALVSSGAAAEPAVAAVLLFRAASYLVPIPVGAACWLVFRQGVGRTRGARVADPLVLGARGDGTPSR
jgi:uncharacterized protein (TIRG00374 family)